MRKKFILVLLITAFAFGAFYFFSKRVVIAATSCSGQNRPCSVEIENLLRSQIGKNYFSARGFLDGELMGNTKVESFSLRFIFPSAINLEIVEKEAVVALAFAPQRIFTFDEEGNVLGEVAETNLPTANVVESLSDKPIKFAAELFLALNKYYNVTSAQLSKFGLKAIISGTEITFPLEGNIDVILGSLEVVLQLKPSTGKIYTVDLRYKNPVIKENE